MFYINAAHCARFDDCFQLFGRYFLPYFRVNCLSDPYFSQLNLLIQLLFFRSIVVAKVNTCNRIKFLRSGCVYDCAPSQELVYCTLRPFNTHTLAHRCQRTILIVSGALQKNLIAM